MTTAAEALARVEKAAGARDGVESEFKEAIQRAGAVEGVPLRLIAQAAGVTRQRVWQIIQEGGEEHEDIPDP